MTQPRRRLSVEQRQEEILAAATDIFSTTPYVEVSTQDIADACGVSQGLLFHYFESKAGLYTAFLKAHTQPLFDDHLDPNTDTHEALRSTLERYLNHVAEHPFVWLAGRRGGRVWRRRGSCAVPENQGTSSSTNPAHVASSRECAAAND